MGHLACQMPFSMLTVEGRRLGQANARTSSVLSQPVSSSSLGNSHSSALSSTAPYQGTSATMFRHVVARRPQPSHTLKIVKARIVKNGRRLNFKPNLQLFMRLIESTANIDSITTAAREEWGTDVVIVTHDGLRIENSPATRV